MQNDGMLRESLAESGLHAREVYEITYLKQRTGATEADIRNAIDKVGRNRRKIERELSRLRMGDRDRGSLSGGLDTNHIGDSPGRLGPSAGRTTKLRQIFHRGLIAFIEVCP